MTLKHEELSNFRKLFAKNPYRSVEPEYFKWKIYDNPIREGHIEFNVMDGKIVGASTLVFKAILVEGREVVGGELGDGFTHTDYRGRGLMASRIKSRGEYYRRKGIELSYGAPVPQIVEAHLKRNHFVCGNAKVISMTKVAGGSLIEKKLAEKLRIGRRPLTAALAKACYRVFYSGWERNLMKKRAPARAIERVERFPAGLDGRWGDDRAGYAFFVLRDERYLNWRFFDNPDSYIVYLAAESGKPVGYVAAKLTVIDGVNVFTVCDFATWRDAPDVFADLMFALESNFKEWGVGKARLYCVEGSPYHRVLREFGYVKSGDVTVIVYSGSEVGGKVALGNGRWHFTIADTDHI